ncbi:hypothetical protein [Streptomyces capitiformicae]|uniref:Uncharacterized protein n=1 Tax=Streptomyces capitiformicae TaxID=2014920 RepID=A0A919GB59_9ACTN|nr:hypothetical protein [Streptomyces capitiformicae]GHH81199.1 hypothetical protein GCM10017771_02480 [Streptomyces capitiformicae]
MPGSDPTPYSPSPPPSSEQAVELAAHWRRLVNDWVMRQHRPYEADASSVGVEFELPEAERRIQLGFTTTNTEMLLVMATDDRYLKPDQLAVAAAAANAWNIERLAPVMSICNLAGEQPPYLMGFSTLPLTCRITRSAFRAMADRWLKDARSLFTWCHRECHL